MKPSEKQQRSVMMPVIEEMRAHHPELWQKVCELTPHKAMPIINEYTGLDMKENMDADHVVRTWVKALVQRRSN